MRDKILHLVRTWCFTSILLVAALATTASATETLSFVTLDYPPYEYEEKGEVKGIAVNLVREVFKRLDYEIEIKVFPWARSLKLVELGQADAIFTAYKTPERALFLDYSNEVLMPQEVSLFVRNKFPVVEEMELKDLAGYRFGARLGVSYGDRFDQAVENETIKSVYRVSEGDALIKMLLNKRVDIIPFNRFGGYYRFQRLGVADDIIELSPPPYNPCRAISPFPKRKSTPIYEIK